MLWDVLWQSVKLGPRGTGAAQAENPEISLLLFFWFLLQSGIFMHHQAITSKKLKITSLFTLYAFFERKSFFFKGCILRGISRQDFFFSYKSGELLKVLLSFLKHLWSLKNTSLLFKENTCAVEGSLYFLLHPHLTNTEPA